MIFGLVFFWVENRAHFTQRFQGTIDDESVLKCMAETNAFPLLLFDRRTVPDTFSVILPRVGCPELRLRLLHFICTESPSDRHATACVPLPFPSAAVGRDADVNVHQTLTKILVCATVLRMAWSTEHHETYSTE
jgi:hypothetical protein